MTVEQKIDGQNDQFPVGMRVLAVDDDPTCLRVLDTLLRKCQYHVTTTSQAITALEMLRENKNKFDLVISDVHMPDMDGFKLLELVGLEMDLPVIMLSAYGDTELVMKGISHGACDYLLKPIRMEELKNIWQHVIRRKKFDPKDQKDFDKPRVEFVDLKEFQEMCDPDQNGKINRKRKDQIDDEDEEHDENGHNNKDPSSQKKPRVVWSVELHRKFVAAVNQLGIDKAVPKRILDLMNVEKLTRENVASHLQKYRLYLKRISCVTSQQANIVAALGNADSAYLRMASLNGLGNLPTLDGSMQFQNAAFGSFRPSSILGRLNSPAGLGMRSLSSSGMVEFGHSQNSSNPVNGLANFHSLSQSGNQNGNILYGMPMSLELDQLQHNQGVNHVGVIPVNDSMMYPISSGFSEMKINVGSSSNPHFSISDDFSDTKINVGSSSNSLFGAPSNSLMVDGNLEDAHIRRVLGNQSSVTTSSLNSGFSSHLPGIERCNDNWPNAVQSSEVHSNLYTLNDCFKQTNPGILRDTCPSIMHVGIDSHDVSSINLAPAQYPDAKMDILQGQAGSGSSGIEQNINVTLQQGWDDSKQDASHRSYLLNSSANSLLPHDVASSFNSSLMRSNNQLWRQL